jgi:DNA-binding PadR family transcriptional regulator
VRAQPPVELTPPGVHVLLALGDEAKHGYAIMQDIAAASGGTIRVLPGTLYSTLKKLLAGGLVEACTAPREADSTDARRRYYRVTRRGRVAAEAETRRLSVLVKLGSVFLK